MGNSLGKVFTVTSFGESHGPVVGAIVDGCPAGLPLTEADIQDEVDKRKPGATGTTSRIEDDKVEILSGIFNGKTTGAPLCLLIHNKDVDSSAYEEIKSLPRPGHADYTAFMKYGGFNDYRGGGRFSGRITATFVMAGAVARKLLANLNVEILAHTVEIGGIRANPAGIDEIREKAAKSQLRCADTTAAEEMSELIDRVQVEGNSIGGIVECIALNVPTGVGEPVFDTIEGELAKALFAIPAIKGIEFGSGFRVAKERGSENNDPFTVNMGEIVTITNNSGGILGGISNGMPVVVRAAVKPTPSISRPQQTVNLQNMENTTIEIKGRHDTCIVPRAVAVVEAMVAVTLCDLVLRAGLMPRVIK